MIEKGRCPGCDGTREEMESLSPTDETQGTVEQARVTEQAAACSWVWVTGGLPPMLRMPPAPGAWVKLRELLFSLHGGGSWCHGTLGRGLAWKDQVCNLLIWSWLYCFNSLVLHLIYKRKEKKKMASTANFSSRILGAEIYQSSWDVLIQVWL